MTLRFVRPVLKPWMIRRIVSCGSPNFLNNLAGRITSILMNVLLLGYGGEAAVSIYGILMYAEGFIQPLLYGNVRFPPACGGLQLGGRILRAGAGH